MASYDPATFRKIEIVNKTLYVAEGQVKWSPSLKRENFYQYNEEIQDYDYLLTTTDMDALFDVDLIRYIIKDKYGERPDILAFDMYGDVDYWWLILLCNGMEKFEDFTVGKEILLPEPSSFNTAIAEANFEIQRAVAT